MNISEANKNIEQENTSTEKSAENAIDTPACESKKDDDKFVSFRYKRFLAGIGREE